MSGISTHVLDTERGRPAPGLRVTLEHQTSGWHTVSEGVTDSNGRIPQFPGGDALQAGVYRLTFHTGGPFFPEIPIVFQVSDVSGHYHVPLLLSSYGYTTYRGS